MSNEPATGRNLIALSTSVLSVLLRYVFIFAASTFTRTLKLSQDPITSTGIPASSDTMNTRFTLRQHMSRPMTFPRWFSNQKLLFITIARIRINGSKLECLGDLRSLLSIDGSCTLRTSPTLPYTSALPHNNFLIRSMPVIMGSVVRGVWPGRDDVAPSLDSDCGTNSGVQNLRGWRAASVLTHNAFSCIGLRRPSDAEDSLSPARLIRCVACSASHQ
jgi:hypothetical protein